MTTFVPKSSNRRDFGSSTTVLARGGISPVHGPRSYHTQLQIMKTKTLIALAAGLIGFAGTANAALTYTWRITGDGEYESSTATVGGQLTLNEAGTQATSLTVEFVEGADLHLPTTAINFVTNASVNSFTVSGDTITGASFGSNVDGSPSFKLYFSGYGLYNSYDTSLYNDSNQSYEYWDIIQNATGLSGVTFTPATSAVPEASTSLGLLALGAGGLLTRRRTSRKA